MAASDREQILIKNIYYMLAYAFKALQQKNYKDMETVQFDNAQNLFAAILAQGISQQLKQGLYKEYIDQEGDLSVLHGKISFPGTIRNQIAHCQQLYCEYDELSENNLLNQIIKTTALILIGSNEVKKEYRQRLRSEMLFFSSVDEVEPSSIRWSDLRFHRNNETYLMLIGICQLVLNGMLQTEDDGSYKLAAFEDSQEMSHLYEKFLLEYYRREHPELKPSASQIRWALDDGVQTALPIMQSDIMLQREKSVLIIDAKYYAHNMQVQYNKHTIHSGNMYQIYTYVKNKEFELEKSGEPHKVSGMLLYAKTLDVIQPDSVFQMHGNQITVRTLDLCQPFNNIRQALDQIADSHFSM